MPPADELLRLCSSSSSRGQQQSSRRFVLVPALKVVSLRIGRVQAANKPRISMVAGVRTCTTSLDAWHANSK